jgi:hypothetical protein
MLKVIELRATADGRSSRPTSWEMNAVDAGALNALATPRPSANPITTHSSARPDQARAASVALSAVATIWVAISSRRAAEPVCGGSGPGGEHEDRDEVAEVQDAEQERRVCEAIDEQQRGEVLEPRPARRGCVADEVRAELARADEAQRRARACLRARRLWVRCH